MRRVFWLSRSCSQWLLKKFLWKSCETLTTNELPKFKCFFLENFFRNNFSLKIINFYWKKWRHKIEYSSSLFCFQRACTLAPYIIVIFHGDESGFNFYHLKDWKLSQPSRSTSSRRQKGWHQIEKLYFVTLYFWIEVDNFQGKVTPKKNSPEKNF